MVGNININQYPCAYLPNGQTTAESTADFLRSLADEIIFEARELHDDIVNGGHTSSSLSIDEQLKEVERRYEQADQLFLTANLVERAELKQRRLKNLIDRLKRGEIIAKEE